MIRLLAGFTRVKLTVQPFAIPPQKTRSNFVCGVAELGCQQVAFGQRIHGHFVCAHGGGALTMPTRRGGKER